MVSNNHLHSSHRQHSSQLSPQPTPEQLEVARLAEEARLAEQARLVEEISLAAREIRLAVRAVIVRIFELA